MLSVTVPSEARVEGGACYQQRCGSQGSHTGTLMLIGFKTMTGRMGEGSPALSLVPVSPPLSPKKHSGSVS